MLIAANWFGYGGFASEDVVPFGWLENNENIVQEITELVLRGTTSIRS